MGIGEGAPRSRIETTPATPVFDDLVTLAQEVARDQEAQEARDKKAPAPAIAEEVKRTEVVDRGREHPEEIAQRELKAREKDAFNTGRFEYLALTGNWQQLDKERAAGFDPRYRASSTFVHIGHNSTWNLNRVPQNPQDYLEALDQAGAHIEKNMSEAGDPVDIDTFYRERADTMLFTVREDLENNLKRTMYIAPRVLCVRDLPKEVAWKLFAQNVYGPTAGRAYLEEYRPFLQKNLQGFIEVAMEQGDLEIALGGYKRMGKLQDPEVISKIRDEMKRLRDSKNPEDQKRLQRASRKLLSLQ